MKLDLKIISPIKTKKGIKLKKMKLTKEYLSLNLKEKIAEFLQEVAYSSQNDAFNLALIQIELVNFLINFLAFVESKSDDSDPIVLFKKFCSEWKKQGLELNNLILQNVNEFLRDFE